MRFLLVDDNQHRTALLRQTLIDGGHVVVAGLATADDLAAAIAQHRPQALLVCVESPTRDILESLAQLVRAQPLPVILFVARSDAAAARHAMRAGIAAYVVDGRPETRLEPVIDVAVARFDEQQALRRELEQTRTRLADRRDVERAKGLLMQRRQISEPQAYEQLRRMAMNRKLTIGDAARALIVAAEFL